MKSQQEPSVREVLQELVSAINGNGFAGFVAIRSELKRAEATLSKELRWVCVQCNRCLPASEPRYEWEDGPRCEQCDAKSLGWE